MMTAISALQASYYVDQALQWRAARGKTWRSWCVSCGSPQQRRGKPAAQPAMQLIIVDDDPNDIIVVSLLRLRSARRSGQRRRRRRHPARNDGSLVGGPPMPQD